jgi:hypothetical protein
MTHFCYVGHDEFGTDSFAGARLATDDDALLLRIDQHIAEHVFGHGKDMWSVVHLSL